MTKLYKIVVTGAFNAGKTTFVNTISDISTVNTDRITSVPTEKIVKEATTTALDYGMVQLNEAANIHLFGTPGQPRFDFMRDILAQGMDGFIFLIDSSDHTRLDKAADLLVKFREVEQAPFLLVANKADLDGLSTEALRTALNLPPNQLVVPCVATEKDSVRLVIEQLVALIEQG